MAMVDGYGGQGTGEVGAGGLIAVVSVFDVGEDGAQGVVADLEPSAVGEAEMAFEDLDPGPGVESGGDGDLVDVVAEGRPVRRSRPCAGAGRRAGRLVGPDLVSRVRAAARPGVLRRRQACEARAP
jgi:hypothetical protein